MLEPDEPELVCPRCRQGNIVKRKGKFGTFYGCTAFPDCRFTADAWEVAQAFDPDPDEIWIDSCWNNN